MSVRYARWQVHAAKLAWGMVLIMAGTLVGGGAELPLVAAGFALVVLA